MYAYDAFVNDVFASRVSIMKPDAVIRRKTETKHGVCEVCQSEGTLIRLKVGSFAGISRYRFVCSRCAIAERLAKY